MIGYFRPMSAPELDPLILSFYRSRYVEDERLTSTPHGRIEFLRTQQLLRSRLPTAPARIADVGGGTGVHARWLAADGHEVWVVDPVPEHVEAAACLPGVAAQVGDARSLALADRSVDVTLLLGPLYHLTDQQERLDALTEAVRITRPNGLVVVAAISRYAALLELAALGALDDEATRHVEQLIRTGVNEDDPHGFTTAYFHRSEELTSELASAGLLDIIVLGVEGPSVPTLDAAGLEGSVALMASALRCAELVESDPAMISASPHLLAFGRCPGSDISCAGSEPS